MRSSRLLIIAAGATLVVLLVGLMVWQRMMIDNSARPEQAETGTIEDYQIGGEPEELKEYTLPAEGEPPTDEEAKPKPSGNSSISTDDSLTSIESDLNSTVIYEEDFSNL